MGGIVVEWALCAVLLLGLGYGAYWLWVRFSWSGKHFQRTHHKAVIETGAEIRCPIHGLFPVAMGIETEHGEVCPDCYREYVRIPTYTTTEKPHA